MCHPPEEVCVGVKGERAVLHTPLPRDILAAPAPASALTTAKRDQSPLQQRVGTSVRIALKCFPKGI